VFKGEGGIPRDDESYGIWMTLVPPPRIKSWAFPTTSGRWATRDRVAVALKSTISAATRFRATSRSAAASSAAVTGTSKSGTTCSWNSTASRRATLNPLPALSVDTGMGLERVTSVIQGKLATYDTDLFAPILDAISREAGRRYTAAPGPLDHPDVSMRVIADHLRAMTFIIGDGVLPSNEGRGYVLRKIMRRAMRHGKKLGFTKPVLHTFVDAVVGEMGDAYPELKTAAMRSRALSDPRRSASMPC
jgi:alanyl-tRNA synthetase